MKKERDGQRRDVFQVEEGGFGAVIDVMFWSEMRVKNDTKVEDV